MERNSSWNPQKDLEKIRAFLGAGGKEDSRSFKKKDHFRLLGVDYYYEGDPAVLAACMEKDYQEIPCFYRMSHILADDLFYKCLAHIFYPLFFIYLVSKPG